MPVLPNASRVGIQCHSSENFTTMRNLFMSKSTSGAAIAAAAALLFSVASISTVFADEATVHCNGVNSCKGQSSCKSASNSCKGQNSCKGKGFKEMTQKDCDAAKAAQK